MKEKKINKQGIPQNKIHKNLNLERKGLPEILPSSLDLAQQRWGRPDSGKNSSLLAVSASSSGILSVGAGVSCL